jgi:hypothetical protein
MLSLRVEARVGNVKSSGARRRSPWLFYEAKITFGSSADATGLERYRTFNGLENSVLFYQAARRAGVPVEMHLFETGPHGFGLAPTYPVLARWPELAAAWMARRGWLAPGTDVP